MASPTTWEDSDLGGVSEIRQRDGARSGADVNAVGLRSERSDRGQRSGAILIDENPYGYDTSGEINSSIDVVRSELAALRADPGATAAEFHHIAGPAARANDDAPADPAEDHGDFMDGLFWFFRGKQYRISKAMRLKYKVGGKTYHILVGYEGSCGGR